MNPPYLSEFPSVDRVLNTMKTADPRETALRQMGAFDQLIEIIKELSGPREFRGFTPDEQRIIGMYQMAQYNVGQAADKAFPNPPKPSTETPYHYSRFDGRFGVEGIQTFKLLSPAIKAEFDRLIKQDNDKREARRQSYINDSRPQQQQSTEVKPGSSEELKRCIASGRPQRICWSESMSKGMDQISGISLQLPSEPGFRMTGDYSSRGGFRLIFQPDQVTMICHAVPARRPYSVEITDTQALVKIQNESKTVVFSLRPDGKLAGSGPIRVTGQVPAGTRTEQTSGMTTQNTTRVRQLEPGEERYYQNATKNSQVWTVKEDTTELVYGPTGTRTVTDYVTKTADCTLGVMNPDGPTPLPPDIESPMGLLTTIASGTAVLMQGGTTQDALKDMLNLDHPIAPGLRMSGKYAGTHGFSITFHPESATLACGDAEQALEYSVQKAGSQTMLQIQDKANPIVLQVKPDGSLFGQGAIQVNGRTIVSVTEDPKNRYIFAPKVARCEVGNLLAGAQVSGTPLGATATTNATAGNGTQTTENVYFAIMSGLPGAPNPLAGRVILILKESLENILPRAGWTEPAPIQAWMSACAAQQPTCQSTNTVVAQSLVAKTTLDATGASAFKNARTGTYYLFGQTLYNGQHLVWHLRIEIKPGENVVTLDQRNAMH